MMISRINSTYENINKNQNVDNNNNSLQTKLMAEQRRLKAVDSDANMDAAEKTKEKMKIQQQIDELNRKMKMEELEKESADTKNSVSKEEDEGKVVQLKDDKEKKLESTTAETNTVKKNDKALFDEEKVDNIRDNQDSKGIKDDKEKSSLEKQLEEDKKSKEGEEKSKQDKLGISPKQLHKMLSTDFELQRERVLNRVAEDKEATEDVLRAEIKSDEIRGTDTKDKREKLVQMREQKPIQIETIDPHEKEAVSKPKNGMKIVIKEDK